MKYYVHRAGQQYGPYSFADLQRYVASGNILPTDLACPEGGTQWVPVSQVLGGAAVQPAAAPQPVAPQSSGQGGASHDMQVSAAPAYAPVSYGMDYAQWSTRAM